jgi:hypothetical protein
MSLMHIKTAWNDYFTESPTVNQSKTYETTQKLSDAYVHVLDCLFRSCISTSGGGALLCTSVQYLLIESTSFFSCKTSSSQGGAIYFSNTNSGQCVLYKVCGYDCCTTSTGSSYGQFVFIQVKDATSSKNNVNYSSTARCVTENSDSYYMLRISYGKICCPSVNISMNKCKFYSGIYCQPLGDSSSFTCSLTYSTFADNIAIGYSCILPWWGGRNIEIKSCNVLRNTQGTLNSGGTIHTHDNVMITDSCILENKATYIFNQASSSYTITISNCTVDSTSKYGRVTIQNTITKSFIHGLDHMSTLNCHSGYDAAGTLTPVAQAPSPPKKPIHCFTFRNYFYQPLSFAIIFIFNFIHPYASIDH